MEASKNVVFPNEILTVMDVENIFSPTNSNEIGIAVLSHLQSSAHIMRIYYLLHNSETSSFEPIQDLISFSFSTRENFDVF